MTAYAVGADGQLTVANNLTVQFSLIGGGENPNFRGSVPTARNPVTGELWAIGYFDDVTGIGVSGAFRLGVSTAGMAEVREAPIDIGAADIGNEIAIGNNGTQLVMAGLSGGCTGTWSLSPGGALPSANDAINVCSGNQFSNGRTIAARASNDVFYQGHSGNSIRIHDVSSGVVSFLGEAATSSEARLMTLLYDDSVLFTIGRNDGDITVFNASADGRGLTEVVAPLTAPVTGVKALTTVSCL